jgi:HTH-type transcriptional repressor of NAD biosynthesis genes
MKKFKVGFIVGKFCPLHYGHMFLINSALSQCEHVIILSYTSVEYENCSAKNREMWLNKLFPDNTTIIVIDPKEVKVPLDSDSPLRHRMFCATIIDKYTNLVPNGVFSSEEYGEGLANFLTGYFEPNVVQNVDVDIERVNYPISGTMCRSNKYYLRDMTHPIVRSSFVKKILILGGESSGKTTLCAKLAENLGVKWVREYGREHYAAKGGVLEFDDMLEIANAQKEYETDATLLSDTDFLICDTSPLTTFFYSQVLFDDFCYDLQQMALKTKEDYDYVFVCSPYDFEFVQDGTRQDSAFRIRGHEFYTKSLDDMGIPYTIVSGTVRERIDQIELQIL